MPVTDKEPIYEYERAEYHASLDDVISQTRYAKRRYQEADQ
jgi:hypothetical protein